MRLRLAAYIASDDWRKKYDYVRFVFKGPAAVRLNGKYGFVNTEGEEIVKPQYDWVRSFHEGFAAVELDGKGWGFVNAEGVEIIEPKYEEVEGFQKYGFDGFAKVSLDDKWGLVNTEGVEVVKPQYDYVGLFYEGLFKVELNGDYGFIDTKGKEVLPPEYSEEYLDSLETYRELGGDPFVILDRMKEETV